MLSNPNLIVSFILALAYLTKIFLFSITQVGPFESRTAFVRQDSASVRPVNVFDRVRRLLGAYRVTVEKDIIFWDVYEPRMAVWRCPTCLSFWMSVFATVPYTMLYGGNPVLFHFSMSFCVSFLVFLHLNLSERL